MKFTYPAVFHKTEQGTYEGYFPDLACCYAKGDTLDEALEDAIHSAYDWISLELTEEEPDFPPVSDVADLGKSEGEIARNIAVHSPDDIVLWKDGILSFQTMENQPQPLTALCTPDDARDSKIIPFPTLSERQRISQ